MFRSRSSSHTQWAYASAPAPQTAIPEDVDQEMVQREMERDLWEEYKLVERVIAMR